MNNVKYYKNIVGLKSKGQQIRYTEDQIKEYIKCTNDPIHFIENYVKIVSDIGVVNFKLYSYQKRIIDAIHQNSRMIGKNFRQSGKCLLGNTVVNIRNKNTGKIEEITVLELFERQQSQAK